MRRHVKDWTSAELRRLDATYPSTFPQEFEQLARTLWPGRTPGAVYRVAYRRGLKKKSLRVSNPRTYERDTDGGYVSGLVDGEGCFRAAIGMTPKGTPYCRLEFKIDLRADDRAILRWVRNYFHCGGISVSAREDGHPMASFFVSSLYDLMHSVIPHFDKYPLRAKKRRDYETWRRLAAVLATTYQRPLTGVARNKVERLVHKLTAGRHYQGGA